MRLTKKAASSWRLQARIFIRFLGILHTYWYYVRHGQGRAEENINPSLVDGLLHIDFV